MHVPNRVVTANATCVLVSRIRVWTFNGLHDLLVALTAGLFSHFTAAWRDVNVVFKPTCREIVGVPETVACFGGVLGYQSRRRVTVIADGHSPMAGLHPTAKLILHDVTIHTGFSIVGHIRVAARVHKGIRADSQQDADRDSQDNSRHYVAHTELEKQGSVSLILSRFFCFL